MPRAVEEWVGRRPESMPGIRVLLRLFDRQNGLCGCGCTVLMNFDRDQIDCDHIIALKDGGENREGNLQLLLQRHHILKTNAENVARGIANQHKAKAFGRQRGRGFRKAEPQHTATRAIVRKSDLPEESRPYRSQE